MTDQTLELAAAVVIAIAAATWAPIIWKLPRRAAALSRRINQACVDLVDQHQTIRHQNQVIAKLKTNAEDHRVIIEGLGMIITDLNNAKAAAANPATH